ANVLQYVDDEGVTVAELHARARTTRDSLAGLQRWGYVRVHDGRVRCTAAGRRAWAVWSPLAALIEARWAERFGPRAIARLRARPGAGGGPPPGPMPASRRIACRTRGGGRAEAPSPGPPPAGSPPGADLSLRLAHALLAFTLDFERESALSLAISANP